MDKANLEANQWEEAVYEKGKTKCRQTIAEEESGRVVVAGNQLEQIESANHNAASEESSDDATNDAGVNPVKTVNMNK